MPAVLPQLPLVWSVVAGWWPPVPVGAPALVAGQPRLARRWDRNHELFGWCHRATKNKNCWNLLNCWAYQASKIWMISHITATYYIVCHLAAICYLYSFLHQHDFSSLFRICSCSNAVSTFNTLSHHTLPTDQNRLNIKHKHVETQVWSCLISHVPPSSPLVLSMWYGPGFAIITWNNPKEFGETLHHQGTKPVNLWGLFSHVTRCLLWWTPG